MGGVGEFFGFRVLGVDDDYECNLLLNIMMKKLGIKADTAFSGIEAIEKIRKNDYDLAFLDIKMPGMDGIEVARVIRTQLGKTFPIVAVTAYSMPEDVNRCYEAGINEVKFKPIELATIRQIVSSCYYKSQAI